MPPIKFFYPMQVRYGDLDPQGHMNNARYLTFFEQARAYYLIELGLFKKGQSFFEIGIILAEARVTYHAPILWGARVKVGVGTTRLGNKSFNVAQNIVNAETGETLASGEVILVAYDYYTEKTIRIPDDWREKIARFEGLK